MPQRRDAHESELRGGRVLMMASGAVDLATGLSARITETPVRPAVARGWCAAADVMADDGWYDELPGSRPMVCVDAWLTRTWSGRWRALRVLVPATASSRSRIGPGRLHGAGAPPGSAWA
nr:hypothetical protein [Acidobacteriota bacterium]